MFFNSQFVLLIVMGLELVFFGGLKNKSKLDFLGIAFCFSRCNSCIVESNNWFISSLSESSMVLIELNFS